MNRHYQLRWSRVAAIIGLVFGVGPVLADDAASQAVDRGRYLVKIAGCNDCHTPGYLQSEGQTPEAQWLTGDSFGWRGPWGTTYPTNLRNLVQGLSEREWVSRAKTFRPRPPMPWFNLRAMEDEDLRAIYHYLRHLGPAGEAAPAYLPPDQMPPPPFAQFPSPPPR